MKRPPSGTSNTPPAAAGSVRIIGGRWRNSRLPVIDVPGLRPTSDRARETLFNWLQPVLTGARVLDLFAGSGALGIEALSRGAAMAMLVERDAPAAAALQASIDRLAARDCATVVRADALSWLRLPVHGRFDIVFIDPPFTDGLWTASLAVLAPWCTSDGWLYVESPAQAIAEPGPHWRLHRHSHTRDAHHALYRRVTEAAATLAALPLRPRDPPP